MTFRARTALAAAGLAAALATGTASVASAATEVTLYYPVAVGGPITKIIDGYVEEFEKSHPDIDVTPVYSGSYQDTITKVLTAVRGGNAPDMAVILSTDMFTLIDEDAIVPFDDLISTDTQKAWLGSFYPAFMENSQTGGKTWGIPFQRSTVVMYWNKEAFKEAGLDPEKAPQTWAELVDYGHKLTKREGDVTTRWGVQIPSSGFPYWLFQTLTTQNGAVLANAEGNAVSYDDPAVVEALQYWADLSLKEKIHAPGVVEWGTTPKDFFEGKTAIMWTTTGNLTNVRKNAPFDFGVAMLPESKRRGSPTGGGNFYVFKDSSEEKQKAALTFIEWVTSPERAAQWGIDTGYVAVRPDAWETPAMKAYVADFPAAAVARDQLPYAVAELSTHENQRVTKVLNDALQAVLTGAEQAEPALKKAQAEADRILSAYR